MGEREDGFELFAIDPRGVKVYCSEERLDDIYSHHPELQNFWANEKDFELAISQATEIYQKKANVITYTIERRTTTLLS